MLEGSRVGYSEIVVDRVQHPRNQGKPDIADSEGTDNNPVCGDELTIWISVMEGIVTRASFQASGCVPTIAAGSMATELISGRPLAEALTLTPEQVDQALGGLPPVKRHCSLLASRAVRKAAAAYETNE